MIQQMHWFISHLLQVLSSLELLPKLYTLALLYQQLKSAEYDRPRNLLNYRWIIHIA